MAGPVIVPVAYPLRPTDFLVFRAWRSSALMSLANIRLSIGQATPVAVFDTGVLDPVYVTGGSTLMGSGTLEVPYEFSLRPEGNWPITGTKINSIAIQAEELALPVNSAGEPPGYEARIPLRQYQSLTNPLATNLVANPLERTGVYAPIQVHQLMVGPQLTSEQTGYATAKAKFLSLSPPIRVIPGFRLMATGGTDLWFSPAKVTSVCTDLAICAALRTLFPGDLAIGSELELDIEDYVTGIEPSESNLVNGHTYAEFCSIWQPFFDLALSLTPIPAFLMYPTIAWTGIQNMHLIQRRWIELAGRDYLHFVTESFGFLNTVNRYRTARYTKFPVDTLAWNQTKGAMEIALGGPIKMRTFIEDDILRDTGAEFTPAVYSAFGRLAPEIQDWTRADRLLWGTPNARKWLTLSTANKRSYHWHGVPLSSAVTTMSTGESASVGLTGWRAAVFTGNDALGPATMDDQLGARLKIGVGQVYAVWRLGNVMPNTVPQAWTGILEAQVPAEVVVDTPIWSQCVSNLKLWQIYIRAIDNHLIWERMVTSVTDIHDLGLISRDTTFKLALARNGNTNWRWALNGSAAANFDAGATIGANTLCVVGGGALPGSGTNNGNIRSCDRFLLVSYGIAPLTMSDADLTIASDLTKPFPVGRGT